MSTDHATWSASATHRNWLCPGNIALSQDVVKPKTSVAADWGTACHAVAERLLNKDVPIDIGDEITTETRVMTITLEMLECASMYVDYINSRLRDGCDLYAVEQKFSLDHMGLPMQIGGTADCVLYEPQTRTLEIVDLKTGKGKFVSAIGNPQERLYALGVLMSVDLKGMPVDWVRTTIVQPRIEHRDGAIRSETMMMGELIDWVIDLIPQVTLAAEATKAYEFAKENTVVLDNWVETFLHPGEEQCTFCPAAGGCPALRKQALAVTGLDYVNDAPILKSNAFADNTPEAIEKDLDLFEQLEAWIRERRALAHEMAIQGHQFDHWHLVDRIGHRKFTLPEADLVKEIRLRFPSVTDDTIYDRKLKSPAGMEKAFGKVAVADNLGDFIIKPVTGTDLIRSTGVARPVRESLVDRFFIEQE